MSRRVDFIRMKKSIGSRIKTLGKAVSRHRKPTALDRVDFKFLGEQVGRNSTVVLEIGANDGQDSMHLAATFPSATIFCFEPDPRAFAALKQLAVGSQFRFLDLAIADVDGTIQFYQSTGAPPGKEEAFPDGYHLSGSIRRPHLHLQAHPWCRFDSAIDVKAQRLDSWSATEELGLIDFIWADVQGAEVDLIGGGQETLARTRYFYTEFNSQELYEGQIDLSRIMSLLPDWEVVQIYKNDVLLKNRALN